MLDIKAPVTLPKATAKRVPVYYRYMQLLHSDQVKRIKSEQLSEMIHIPSATIRRDFSYLGDLGRSGYGYDVDYLIQVFSAVLKVNTLKRIALVGVGNLGRALMKNNFRRNDNLKITCAFDHDSDLVGSIFADIPVFSMSQLAKIIHDQGIRTAISTVPSKNSQEVMDELVKANITSVLNFAPGRVNVPETLKVQYIDFTSELQTLIYFDEHDVR